MIGVTFCTVDGVDMKVHVLGTVNNKKGEFQSGEDCSSSNRDGDGDGDEKDAAAATTAERSERGK